MKLGKIAVASVAVAMLCTSLLGGTVANYTTTATSDGDSIQVAEWNLAFNKEEFTTTEVFEFDLFGDQKYIAPGDSGEYTFTVKNNSDVDATYKIMSNNTTNYVTNGNYYDGADDVPLLFNIDGANNGKFATLEYWVRNSSELEGTLEAGEKVTHTITYKWAADGNDAYDTSLATMGETPVYSVTSEIVVDQVLGTTTK